MQFELFNAAALDGPSATTYHFWSDEHNLFYRDDHYLNSTIFWGRGNGWAMGGNHFIFIVLHFIPSLY